MKFVQATHEPLLPASTSTSTTELLRLHPSGICDQQRPVIRYQLFLQLHCAVCVDVLGVVCDNSLGDSLADSIHLRRVSSTLGAHTDIKGCERLFTSHKYGLVDLEAEDLRLDKVDGRAIHADDTTTLLCVGDCSSSLKDSGISRELSQRRCCDLPSFCRMSGRPLL